MLLGRPLQVLHCPVGYETILFVSVFSIMGALCVVVQWKGMIHSAQLSGGV